MTARDEKDGPTDESGTDGADTAAKTESEYRPLLEGTIIGGVAWLVGYVLTAVAAQPTMDGDPRMEILEAATGQTVTVEALAWTYFNAHLVTTEIPQGGMFTLLPPEQNVLLDGPGLEWVLFSVPPLVLLVGGALVTQRHLERLESPIDGAITGAMIAVGYLLVTIVALLVTTLAVDSGVIRASPFDAILIAGLVYPFLFGAIGGTVTYVVQDRMAA